MPLALYQTRTKLRNENRPRFGLLRGRELVMLNSYNFVATRERLDRQFNNQKAAYKRIFKRTGVTVHPVIADSGTVDDKSSAELQTPAAIGEDTIATNKKSTYAANLEMAKSIDTFKQEPERLRSMEGATTPGCKTIEQLTEFLRVPATRIVESISCIADDQKILILICADKQINEIKLGHLLDANEVHEATAEELVNVTGSEKGGVGPVKADWADRIIADEAVRDLYNIVAGANETSYQSQNANLNHDFKVDESPDVRTVNEGESDPVDHLPLQFTTSIGVGHIFKLGTYYTETMGADFFDQDGKAWPVIMGSYGIGITGVLSVAVEQNLTKHGVAWPKEIAPFVLHLIQMEMKDEV